jgi:hypothetical protein
MHAKRVGMDARPHLLDPIRHRPKPRPEPITIYARRWQSDSRRADAVRCLRLIPSTSHAATALRVAPSTVRRWRVGACTPTVRHWRQLRSLHCLLSSGRP